MKGLFKLIFGIIGGIIITAIIIVVTLAIGASVTGTWDITKWGKQNDNSDTSFIVEYNQCEKEFTEYVLIV